MFAVFESETLAAILGKARTTGRIDYFDTRIGFSPFSPVAVVVAKGQYGPCAVDDEEQKGKRGEAEGLPEPTCKHLLRSAVQAQPAAEESERREQPEAHHIAQKAATHVGGAQPLCKPPRSEFHLEMVVAELARVTATGAEPLLQAEQMHEAHGAGAVADGQQRRLMVALVADAAHGTAARRHVGCTRAPQRAQWDGLFGRFGRVEGG